MVATCQPWNPHSSWKFWLLSAWNNSRDQDMGTRYTCYPYIFFQGPVTGQSSYCFISLYVPVFSHWPQPSLSVSDSFVTVTVPIKLLSWFALLFYTSKIASLIFFGKFIQCWFFFFLVDMWLDCNLFYFTLAFYQFLHQIRLPVRVQYSSSSCLSSFHLLQLLGLNLFIFC